MKTEKGVSAVLPRAFGLTSDQRGQCEFWEKINKDRHWGLPNSAFAAARAVATIYDPRYVTVLVPYLPATTRVGGVTRTYVELRELAAGSQEASGHYLGPDQDALEKIQVFGGEPHEPGLRWERLDLSVNVGSSPRTVQKKSGRLPHAGILALAALDPTFVRSMDGKNVPFIWMAGYDMQTSEGRHAPLMRFDGDGRGFGVMWYHYADENSKVAVPEFASE